jgi:hypothetical protein
MNVHSTINLYRHTSCERQIARSSRDSVRKTWIHIYLPVPFCFRVNESELLTQERMGSCFLGGILL